ncbi:MAG: hypothetical protein ACYDH4_08705 [Candidatus Cryosericum sp.]
MTEKLGESNAARMGPRKGWRVSATIKDKDLELTIKHRLVDDEISQEQLVIEGIYLYLAQKPKHFVSSKYGLPQPAGDDAMLKREPTRDDSESQLTRGIKADKPARKT